MAFYKNQLDAQINQNRIDREKEKKDGSRNCASGLKLNSVASPAHLLRTSSSSSSFCHWTNSDRARDQLTVHAAPAHHPVSLQEVLGDKDPAADAMDIIKLPFASPSPRPPLPPSQQRCRVRAAAVSIATAHAPSFQAVHEVRLDSLLRLEPSVRPGRVCNAGIELLPASATETHRRRSALLQLPRAPLNTATPIVSSRASFPLPSPAVDASSPLCHGGRSSAPPRHALLPLQHSP